MRTEPLLRREIPVSQTCNAILYIWETAVPDMVRFELNTPKPDGDWQRIGGGLRIGAIAAEGEAERICATLFNAAEAAPATSVQKHPSEISTQRQHG